MGKRENYLPLTYRLAWVSILSTEWVQWHLLVNHKKTIFHSHPICSTVVIMYNNWIPDLSVTPLRVVLHWARRSIHSKALHNPIEHNTTMQQYDSCFAWDCSTSCPASCSQQLLRDPQIPHCKLMFGELTLKAKILHAEKSCKCKTSPLIQGLVRHG